MGGKVRARRVAEVPDPRHTTIWLILGHLGLEADEWVVPDHLGVPVLVPNDLTHAGVEGDRDIVLGEKPHHGTATRPGMDTLPIEPEHARVEVSQASRQVRGSLRPGGHGSRLTKLEIS